MDLTEEGFKMKIEVCHVEKSLKGRKVLKDISCVMERGKFMAFMVTMVLERQC